MNVPVREILAVPSVADSLFDLVITVTRVRSFPIPFHDSSVPAYSRWMPIGVSLANAPHTRHGMNLVVGHACRTLCLMCPAVGHTFKHRVRGAVANEFTRGIDSFRSRERRCRARV